MYFPDSFIVFFNKQEGDTRNFLCQNSQKPFNFPYNLFLQADFAIRQKRKLPHITMQQLLFLFCDLFCAGTEQKRNAPNTRECHDRVHDAADDRRLTAAKPCDAVKAEQTDRAPVQRTDNGKDKRYSVNNHVQLPLRFSKF